MKLQKLILLAVLCGFSFSSLTIFADETVNTSFASLPPYYPEYFEHSAVITDIDKKNGELVFGVLRVKYDLNIQVHLLNTEFGTVDQLLSRMPVGFIVHTGSVKNGYIKQLWQLPVGAIPAH